MSTAALLISAAMILGNAFFVAYEFSLVAVRRGELTRLADQGNKKAMRVLDQIEHTDAYLATCQFGITLTSLAITAAFEPAMQKALAPLLQTWMSPQLATGATVFAAIVIATSITVVFGELFPKTVAITIPARMVMATAQPMQWAYVLSTPLIVTYNRMANWVVERLTGKSVQDAIDNDFYGADVLLGLAFEQGKIDEEQRDLMSAVIEFPMRTAREVMTPANAVVSLDVEDDDETVSRRLRESKHTRYPLFDGDQLLGYVLIHEVFRQQIEGKFDLGSIVRELPRVPETVRLDALHAEAREHPIMAVFDERNQFVGIITNEDLAEEIVGENFDEYAAPERPTVERLPSGNVLIDGTALIEEVCDEIGFEAEHPDGVDTFGGLLMTLIEREPRAGDRVHWNGWEFTIKESVGFSIRLIEGKPAPLMGLGEQPPAAQQGA